MGRLSRIIDYRRVGAGRSLSIPIIDYHSRVGAGRFRSSIITLVLELVDSDHRLSLSIIDYRFGKGAYLSVPEEASLVLLTKSDVCRQC